ncbi:hypothetical protein MMJ50_11565 [Enterococcus cecorum]|uniref:hypothetical protein n=1 Tax=Enterococcus cecorum TaxID=44008 RepID=UPI001FACF2B6|nr:hypothetical protein [Enterococcus cecorum]MCJ0593304.1 hypothetical protein [Enterococcus cecorum]
MKRRLRLAFGVLFCARASDWEFLRYAKMTFRKHVHCLRLAGNSPRQGAHFTADALATSM